MTWCPFSISLQILMSVKAPRLFYRNLDGLGELVGARYGSVVSPMIAG